MVVRLRFTFFTTRIIIIFREIAMCILLEVQKVGGGCCCSRVAQTATDFADASHSKSAKSAATTISYGIFSSENAYPCTVTGGSMSKKATEFQKKSMSRLYRGREIFKPLNTGWIDEHVACVREWVANSMSSPGTLAGPIIWILRSAIKMSFVLPSKNMFMIRRHLMTHMKRMTIRRKAQRAAG